MSNNLCEELLVEILSRLPSKSLLRFRSASKSLCARIGSHGFIRLHTLRSPNKIMITRQQEYRKNVYTLHSQDQFPYNHSFGRPLIDFPFNNFSIVGSCNGILCVYESRKRDIHLWNPSIRRKVTIHDFYSFRVLGFGFDPTIEDYKILKIAPPTSFIYTMKTHTWREIASPITTCFTFVTLRQCLFNGALHWAVKRDLTDAGDYIDVCHYYIMKFDLSSEVFSTIELPEPTWKTIVVTIIKGCLAVISSGNDDHSSIWVRREYNSNDASWSLAYKLATFPIQIALRVLQITPNDELLYIIYPSGILAYNLGTKELSRVVNLSDYSTRFVDMCMCVESLELLDMGLGTSCEGSKSGK